MSRQSAFDSGEIMELSWTRKGGRDVAARFHPQGRAQIVGALVVFGKIVAEERRLSRSARSLRPASRRISGTRNKKPQTNAETGLPGTPSTCIAPI